MQLKDVTYIIRSIKELRDSIPEFPHGATVANQHNRSMRGGIRKVLRIIEQAPVMDAVAVTRCKNCANRHTGKCPMVYEDLDYTGSEFIIIRDNATDDGFCDKGLPKEGDMTS